jgi:thiol-disulfide isomerase/thioredoxin
MKLRSRGLVVMSLLLPILMAMGCPRAKESPHVTSHVTISPDEPSPVATGKAASDIRLRLADRATLDAVLEDHRGKVVVVDFWATWCGPCVRQFPHTVEISQQYDPAHLAVISVSMDEPDSREKVLSFLQEQGANFDNLISQYGVGLEGFDAFEIEDGAIPFYKIYDRTGELRHSTHDGEEVETLIQQLLNE